MSYRKVFQCEREQEDPRGRTPLHLAVTLGKVLCADVLLRNGANALAINRHNWTGDPSPFSTHIAFPFHFLICTLSLSLAQTLGSFFPLLSHSPPLPLFRVLLNPTLPLPSLSPSSPSLSPTVLQECVAQASPELIGMVLRYRDQQQSKLRSQEIPLMLDRLQTTPDYYIEMRWEVSSWGECVVSLQ